MSVVVATLQLYRDCAKHVARVWPRSIVAFLVLCVANLALAIGVLVVGPLHEAGGFALGIFQAFLAGWYLALIEIANNGTRSVTVADVGDNLSKYFIKTLWVGFIVSIPIFLIGMASGEAAMILAPTAALVFSATPEMIYQEDKGDIELLQQAATFAQNNWPEWFAPQVLFAVIVLAPLGMLDLHNLGYVAQIFGPFYEFVGFAMPLPDPVAIGVTVVLVAIAHTWMLFRAVLYRRLARSTRRGRIWASRAT